MSDVDRDRREALREFYLLRGDMDRAGDAHMMYSHLGYEGIKREMLQKYNTLPEGW
jgi:hypothetical protein